MALIGASNMAAFSSLTDLNLAKNSARLGYHLAMYNFDKLPDADNWRKLIAAMDLHQNLQCNSRQHFDRYLQPTGKYYTLKP